VRGIPRKKAETGGVQQLFLAIALGYKPRAKLVFLKNADFYKILLMTI